MKKKIFNLVLPALCIILISSLSIQAQDQIPLLSYDFENAEIYDKEAPPSFIEDALLTAYDFSVEQGPAAALGAASVQPMWYLGGNGMWFMHLSVSPYPTDYNRFVFGFIPNSPIAITHISYNVAHNYYWYVYYGEMDFIMEFYDEVGTLITSFVSQKVPTGGASLVSFDPTDFILEQGQEVFVKIRAKSQIGGWVSPYTSQFRIDNVQISGYSMDIDNDDVLNDDDNCIEVYNPDQGDIDEDGYGDVCDTCPYDADNDADEDGVCGDIDNCPTIDNADQIDADTDGFGDVCDACPNDPENDADEDGVCGDVDECLDTEGGELVNAVGCSIADICPSDGEYKNHGKYVSCVAHAAEDFLEAGLISDEEKDAIVSAAARSKEKPGRKK